MSCSTQEGHCYCDLGNNRIYRKSLFGNLAFSPPYSKYVIRIVLYGDHFPILRPNGMWKAYSFMICSNCTGHFKTLVFYVVSINLAFWNAESYRHDSLIYVRECIGIINYVAEIGWNTTIYFEVECKVFPIEFIIYI